MSAERPRAFNPLPVMKMWNTLLVPLQGEVTDDLADRIHSEVLNRVYESEIDSIIIDITGLWLLDSHICAMLAALGASSRLMGARAVVCGMSAEIAQTLQMMDIGLDDLESALNIEDAFGLLGLHVSRRLGVVLDGDAGDPASEDSDDEPREER